jgi:hypothetical protein
LSPTTLEYRAIVTYNYTDWCLTPLLYARLLCGPEVVQEFAKWHPCVDIYAKPWTLTTKTNPTIQMSRFLYYDRVTAKPLNCDLNESANIDARFEEGALNEQSSDLFLTWKMEYAHYVKVIETEIIHIREFQPETMKIVKSYLNMT